MILSDREIEAALEHGFIKIHPVPDRALWTSTAIDLSLDAVLLKCTPKPAKTGTKQQIRPNGAGEFNIKDLMNDPNRATNVVAKCLLSWEESRPSSPASSGLQID